jgi:hypothetical protein
MKDLPTAEIALSSWGGGTDPDLQSCNFVCPHCHALTQQYWGVISVISVHGRTRRKGVSPRMRTALCMSCDHESIFFDGRLVHPSFGQAPPPTDDLPEEIIDEYTEAASILSLSPRGAAALLRLAIQKLCPVLGATKSDINAAIGELVAAGKVSASIQQALDSVRVIGNESVHPGQMDLKDDVQTAHALFGLINFIVEKAITEPKKVEAIYASLPANKLAGIAARDGLT